jgi:ribosomal protein S27AE
MSETLRPVARCPRCGEWIDRLVYIQQATVWFKGQYDGNGYSMVFEDNRMVEREEYRCPACGALLAENEGEAMKILGERSE